MMPLSLMQAVVATVNEQWASPLADKILQHWDHDEGHTRYWRASANFVFFFKHQDQDCILRFNHTNERSVTKIRAEMNYIKLLAERGIRVAKPIRSLIGNEVESVDTELGIFHAVAFEALKGDQLEIDELTPAQFTQWGSALGNLHNASAQISVSERPSWRDLLKMVSEVLPAEEKEALRTLNKLQEQLSQIRIDDNNFGLVHYDFEPDNIIWDGDTAGIIDFDDSAYHWYVADIALALGDLFEDGASSVDLQNASFLQFIKGYRKVRQLEQEELNLIPVFMRLDSLVTFAKLYRALTPVNPQGEPAWMAGLRDKLVAKMQVYRGEFASTGS